MIWQTYVRRIVNLYFDTHAFYLVFRLKTRSVVYRVKLALQLSRIISISGRYCVTMHQFLIFLFLLTVFIADPSHANCKSVHELNCATQKNGRFFARVDCSQASIQELPCHFDLTHASHVDVSNARLSAIDLSLVSLGRNLSHLYLRKGLKIVLIS